MEFTPEDKMKKAPIYIGSSLEEIRDHYHDYYTKEIEILQAEKNQKQMCIDDLKRQLKDLKYLNKDYVEKVIDELSGDYEDETGSVTWSAIPEENFYELTKALTSHPLPDLREKIIELTCKTCMNCEGMLDWRDNVCEPVCDMVQGLFQLLKAQEQPLKLELTPDEYENLSTIGLHGEPISYSHIDKIKNFVLSKVWRGGGE